MTAHRHIQLANLVDILQSKRISWYTAARKCAEIGNLGGMKFFLSKAHRSNQIIARAMTRFGQAA